MASGNDGREAAAVTPDTKDWTWVLAQRCPDCGYDASALSHTEVAALIRRDADDWTGRLAAPSVGVRPEPGVWSVLEYGCHVRDVHRIFAHRVRLMLDEDAPRFPNWDQDETALTDDYPSQDPVTVSDDLREAAADVAATYDSVPTDAWSRRGLRSNGSEFTVESIALYHLHDVVHHAWDVRPR
ncbi:methyltransferase type 12 [Mycobacterium antarcticum]|uniref:DinB family protein n=1 Tax=Mycolicibacterium sp. TUM20983 TaxID=3023369 RepID=UPI00239229ED|nr:DinB family protein [Mycolicibacterium sp. TUM20983]GLP75937.1 methyltransferase type 12 [Mycolicibacterium sp. TUM20983]